MKFCFYISRRLPAYCEGEVSSEESVQITAHLASCADCRARSEQIRGNIRLMRQLPLQDPADELWDAIAGELSLSGRPEPVRAASFGRWWDFGQRWMPRPAAVVAVLLVIATALLLASRYGPYGPYGLLPGSHQGELNLAGYLDLVGTVAAAESLKEFPAAPGFTTVSWPEARATIDFPVIDPEVLPGGYRLTAVRLYTRGEVRALQLKYRSEQGCLCVFQLPARSKLSLGDQPSEFCTAGGVWCQYTRNKSCSAYSFTLDGTRCLLMVSQADAAAAGPLIQAFSGH